MGMHMLVTIIILLSYAILNRLRGNATIPKFLAYALFGALATSLAWHLGLVQTTMQVLVFWVLASLGYTYGFIHCWGKYFPQPLDTSAEICVRIVNACTNAVYGSYTSTTPIPQALNWKTIGMGFRFMIFFAPLMIVVGGLTIWLGTDVFGAIVRTIAAILLLFVVGLLYRIGFTIAANNPALSQYNVAISEVLTGFWLGLLALLQLS